LRTPSGCGIIGVLSLTSTARTMKRARPQDWSEAELKRLKGMARRKDRCPADCPRAWSTCWISEEEVTRDRKGAPKKMIVTLRLRQAWRRRTAGWAEPINVGALTFFSHSKGPRSARVAAQGRSDTKYQPSTCRRRRTRRLPRPGGVVCSGFAISRRAPIFAACPADRNYRRP
jgi:hypothetical protein